MTLRERINEASKFSIDKEYDTAHKLYCEVLQDSPTNKRALYCKAVNLYNWSYDTDGSKQLLIECLRCCKLYVKGEPKNRHVKVKELALMAYETLLDIETGIWIEA